MDSTLPVGKSSLRQTQVLANADPRLSSNSDSKSFEFGSPSPFSLIAEHEVGVDVSSSSPFRTRMRQNSRQQKKNNNLRWSKSKNITLPLNSSLQPYPWKPLDYHTRAFVKDIVKFHRDWCCSMCVQCFSEAVRSQLTVRITQRLQFLRGI